MLFDSTQVNSKQVCLSTGSLFKSIQFEMKEEDEQFGQRTMIEEEENEKCCRLFSEPNFRGTMEEFCIHSTAMIDFSLFDREEPVASWECGYRTQITFCGIEDKRACLNNDVFSEADGYNRNSDTGFRANEVKQIIMGTSYAVDLMPTVFSEPKCQGKSQLTIFGLTKDVNEMHNDFQPLNSGTIRSVSLPYLTQIHVYDEPNFTGRVWSFIG